MTRETLKHKWKMSYINPPYFYFFNRPIKDKETCKSKYIKYNYYYCFLLHYFTSTTYGLFNEPSPDLILFLSIQITGLIFLKAVGFTAYKSLLKIYTYLSSNGVVK